jgi:hypothetical protein
MKIRNNLGSFYSVLGGNNSSEVLPPNVGRVFHVVMDSKSVGYDNSSDIGTVYVLKNNSPKPNINFLNTKPTKEELTSSGLKPAKPLFPYIGYIPLNEELVLLLDLPSYNSDVINGASQTYYVTSINLYNNPHHNSQAVYNIIDNTKNNIKLGNYIDELPIINPLLPFEGDVILNSRWGAGLRFSSTFKFNEGENFWSYTGKTGDPLTLLVNGYKFPTDSTDPYIENINNDKSSLYLTSTQVIPIQIGNIIINPLFTPQSPEKYYDSQAILSANRILINSNKDEILLYSKTNTSISSKNTTFISATQNVLINGGQYIFLGLNSNNGKLPTEPVLLGDKTITLLNNLLTNLKTFSSALNNAIDNSSRPLLSISAPASSLEGSIDNIIKQLEGIKSKKVYTI